MSRYDRIARERAQAEKRRERRTAVSAGPPDPETVLYVRSLMTETQFAYFSEHAAGRRVKDIALAHGVHPSVVSRTLKRARARVESARRAGEVFQSLTAASGMEAW